ncbi:hypothetical protein BDR04DRAFT_1161849 [Suillus decipiens]|nr:hypothetical protein BDR04DRAFT_1161849 [Suillus decipiens]
MNTYLESITLPLCISLLDLDCRQGSIESSAGFIFPYFAGISFGRTRLHHSPEHRSLAVNTILQARSQVTRGASVVFTTGIFIVSDSAPRIVAVIALSEDINTRGCVQALKKSNEEIPSINENMVSETRPFICISHQTTPNSPFQNVLQFLPVPIVRSFTPSTQSAPQITHHFSLHVSQDPTVISLTPPEDLTRSAGLQS